MALKKIFNNQYVKIDLKGNFIIYKNIKERSLEKNSTSFLEIKKKYSQIIESLENNLEQKYYDPEFLLLINEWKNEQTKYLRAHMQGLKAKNFPLMSQYIPDIENSLPEIICKGTIGLSNITPITISDVYNYAKKYKIFNDTEDC